MRALFFADTPHRLAGAQRSLLVQLERLSDFGVEPHVAFPGPGAFRDACERAGIRSHALDGPPAFRTFGRKLMGIGPVDFARVVATELLPYSFALARLADRLGAPVMHFNTPRGIVMAGHAARPSGRAAVLHLRGVPAIGRAYWTAAQALGDAFVLVARALLRDFAPSARPRCRVVYNGVVVPPARDRAAARRAVEARLGRSLEGRFLVLSLSSVVPFKGLHHLLDATEGLLRRGVPALVLCAGAGQGDAYEAWLRARLAASPARDAFSLLGFVDGLGELLAAADAVALPSVEDEWLDADGARLHVRGTEGLPRTVLESLAAGAPVVATRVAGVEEQIEDGRTGLVVPPSDPRALEDALARLAAEPSLGAAFAARGPEVVRARFSVEAAARGLAEVLLANAAPPSWPARLGRAGAALRDALRGPR